MVEQINISKAPAAIGPYSQAIKSGEFLFVSGQIPVNPSDNSIPDSIEAQARQALTNLNNIIEEAGGSTANVVKTTVFIKNMGDFATVNSIYAEFFSKPFPARSCIEISALPKGVLVEVEAIAAI